jgi:Putative zinc-finger
MTCEEARALFSAHVDGAMDPGAVVRLNNHLAACPGCQRELTRFQQIVGALRSLPEVGAPAGFLPRVMGQVPQEPWLERVLRSIFLPLSVKLPFEAAAMVLIGILTVTLYRGSPAWQRDLTPSDPNGPGALSDAPSRDVGVPAEAERQPTELRASTPHRPNSDTLGTHGGEGHKRSKGPPDAPSATETERRTRAREPAARPDSPQTEARPADKLPAAPGQIGGDDQGATRARKRIGGSPEEAPAMAGARPGSPESRSASERQSAVRTTPSAHVEGVLRVKDRAGLDRALPPVLDRAGATLTVSPDGSTLTISVPRPAFARLASDLQDLGSLTLVAVPDPLPDIVRVVLRIGT